MTKVYSVHRDYRNEVRELGVVMMDERERSRHLVKFSEDGRLLNSDGKPFAASDGATPRRAIFVMDLDGNLYAVLHSFGRTPGQPLICHSSFLAGGEVLMAGELVVANGEIKSISNHSGHYKPSKSSLDELVKYLGEKFQVKFPKVHYRPNFG